MKKLLLSLAVATVAIVNANAQNCGCVELSGALINRNLVNDSCYILKGCVTVPNGSVLNIEAGTIIYGDNTTNAEGALIIERGGQIFADGFPSGATQPNPIVFTSINPPGSRQPGDWGGIIIAGYGPNNAPGGTFQVEGPCVPIIAGGTNCNDNSGIFRYVRIEYAGVDASSVPGGGNEINSLTLAAVGRGTTIDHIQVSYANDDAFEWFGGCVDTRYLVAYNTKDDDFDTDFGFTGRSQFGIALRQDPNMHDVSGSNGIESDNNNDAVNNYGGIPQTHPIFSNYSLIGPMLCNGTSVHSEFKSGAQIRRNSAHSLFNSIITGWPEFGMRIDNAPTIGNTGADILNWSYNDFFNNGAVVNNPTPWAANGGCDNSMYDWLFNENEPCSEEDNFELPSFSYTGVCNLRCNNGINPAFHLSPRSGAANYTHSDLLDAFFDKTPNYRGAFGASIGDDWTIGWTNWCPQEANYCLQIGARSSKAVEKASDLQLVPNPSNSTTHAVFTAEAIGKVTITILDKVSGKALRVINAEVTTPGEQRIAFDVSGLQLGVYTVRVQTAESILAQQLMVR